MVLFTDDWAVQELAGVDCFVGAGWVDAAVSGASECD
jgi:hypothetical protein